MDPASLSILAHALEPALGLLALAVLPIGLVYLLKSHKIRMRELDLQEKMLASGGGEKRIAAIEERLTVIEAALGTAPLKSLQERAALLEGPATSGENPAPLRSRDR